MPKNKILYFYPQVSTFIEKDISFLSKHFYLKDYSFSLRKKWMLPFCLLHQIFFLIIHIQSSKFVFCRFGGYHALMPVLFSYIFRRKNMILLGGVECHCFPEIRYGFCTNRALKKTMEIIQKYSQKIAVVHKSLYEGDYTYAPTKGKQGLKQIYNTDRSKVIELKNGYDSSVYYNRKYSRDNWSFLTVPGRIDHKTYWVKGIDILIELCSRMPSLQLTVVGEMCLNGQISMPGNIRILPKIKSCELAEVYNQHRFYFQLSMAEGFPNALCEAMLCGCVPIGSDVFGIPEIIGDAGFLLRRKNIEELIQIIKNLKNFDIDTLSEIAEQRILMHFQLKERNQSLLNLINHN